MEAGVEGAEDAQDADDDVEGGMLKTVKIK